MEFITVECMNTKPHAPHTWREGFMWHRKRECGGVPERHKHRFILQYMAFIDPRKLVWHCECGRFISTYRTHFHEALKNSFMYPVKNLDAPKKW